MNELHFFMIFKVNLDGIIILILASVDFTIAVFLFFDCDSSKLMVVDSFDVTFGSGIVLPSKIDVGAAGYCANSCRCCCCDCQDIAGTLFMLKF